MTKEDIGKLKQAIASFGHWYDKIGRVSIVKNEEKVLIFEKSIEYFEELEKENAELKEKCTKLEQGYVWHDYDAGEDSYEDSHEGRWVKRDEVCKLDKAKELLKKFIHLLKDADYTFVLKNTHLVLSEAERFLKEVDK